MDVRDLDDLLGLLRRHPEWRAALRREVLSEELLSLPETTAALVQRVDALTERMDALTERMDALTERMDALAERMDALTERMDALTERMDALTERMDALTERMDALVVAQERTEQRLAGLVEQVSGMATRLDGVVGYVVERRYHDKAHAYFSSLARRIHVLTPDELEDVLEAALAAGQLDERAAQEVRLADVVARGRRGDQETFLVVEASRVVDEHDLLRAVGRAQHLRRTGRPALAIVAGEVVIPDIAARARAEGVFVVTNGRVDAPDRAA